MNKKYILALIAIGTFAVGYGTATIESHLEAKKKKAIYDTMMMQFRKAAEERIRKMEEQEDFDIKFDLIMNINFN